VDDNNWSFKSVNTWESSQLPLRPSFGGPDLDFTVKSDLLSEDRGTACCIKLESQHYHDLFHDPIGITMNNNNNSLAVPLPFILVGISQVKSVKYQFGYLSRLYAV
jgi:hypothetical protein